MVQKPESRDDFQVQWDEIAVARHRQIQSGLDRSFHEVLAPAILRATSRAKPHKALDIGCGSGRLAALVAEHATSVVAVDPSVVSVDLAIADNYKSNITYLSSSIENYARITSDRFDFIYSNMVLMDVAALENVLRAAASVSCAGAEMHATITHPFFWPRYAGYDSFDWFDYRQELHITLPFRISNETLLQKTTHIHRPLETYISSFYDAGFCDIRIRELSGPEGGAPRFMHLSARAA